MGAITLGLIQNIVSFAHINTWWETLAKASIIVAALAIVGWATFEAKLRDNSFSYFAEIANEIIQDNQPNPPLFRLLRASLEAGELNEPNRALVRYYEIWSLRLSGLLPNYAYCSNCAKCVKDDGFFAWIESGQVRCHGCAHGRGLKLGAEAATALDSMMRLGPGQFMARPLSRDSAAEIERLSQSLLGLQLERELKGKLLSLRRRYLQTQGDKQRLKDLMAASLSTFLVLFRAALRLFQAQVPATKIDALTALAQHISFDPLPFRRVYALKEGRSAPDDLPVSALFADYLRNIEKVIEAIDKHIHANRSRSIEHE